MSSAFRTQTLLLLLLSSVVSPLVNIALAAQLLTLKMKQRFFGDALRSFDLRTWAQSPGRGQTPLLRTHNGAGRLMYYRLEDCYSVEWREYVLVCIHSVQNSMEDSGTLTLNVGRIGF